MAKRPASDFTPTWHGPLCHPDAKKSCGACCGAYNTPQFRREELELTWSARYEAFGDTSDQGLRQFAEQNAPSKHQKLQPALPTCPFVGFLDDRHTKVGCLVHPTRIGRDGRDFGVYDAEVCESYLCAAHDLLKGYEKWLIVEAIEDSTTYGLVVFDVRFVRLLFDLTAEINAAEVLPHRLARPGAIKAACAYFALKVDWPFAARDGVFGHWRAGDALDTPPRTTPAAALEFAQSPWDAVLLCLGTHVETHAALKAARTIVAERVHDFAIQVA